VNQQLITELELWTSGLTHSCGLKSKERKVHVTSP